MSIAPPPDDPKPEKPGLFGKLIGTVGTALGVMERTADGAFKSTSPYAPLMLASVIIGLIALALGAVIGIAGVATGKENLGYGALVLAGLAILALVVAMVVVRPRTPPSYLPGNRDQQPVPAPKADAQWSRIVPKIPILPEERLEELQTELGKLRSRAVTAINSYSSRQQSPVPDEHVRVNVFLVGTDRAAEYGEVCGLFIPKKLYHNMASDRDRDIRFRPHEGLTGRTYTLGKPGGAKTPGGGHWKPVPIPADTKFTDGEWQTFSLSPEQLALIHQDLRWIVSFPLRYPGVGKQQTFGVLNIDGLVEELADQEMDNLYQQLNESVTAFAVRLAALPKARVSIQVEDVP